MVLVQLRLVVDPSAIRFLAQGISDSRSFGFLWVFPSSSPSKSDSSLVVLFDIRSKRSTSPRERISSPSRDFPLSGMTFGTVGSLDGLRCPALGREVTLVSAALISAQYSPKVESFSSLERLGSDSSSRRIAEKAAYRELIPDRKSSTMDSSLRLRALSPGWIPGSGETEGWVQEF